jgi:hypothetical protein
VVEKQLATYEDLILAVTTSSLGIPVRQQRVRRGGTLVEHRVDQEAPIGRDVVLLTLALSTPPLANGPLGGLGRGEACDPSPVRAGPVTSGVMQAAAQE